MNRNLRTLIFPLLMLLGMTSLAFSQATITWVYDNVNGHLPLANQCTGGTPLADGAAVAVKWDWNGHNGPDASDPCPTDANWCAFQLNGEFNGQGPGFFYTDPSLVIPVLPASDSSYYYLELSVTGTPGACWHTQSFHIDPGPQDISIENADWICASAPCATTGNPPSPATNVQATDNTLCVRVTVTWDHDGQNVDGFNVRDENLVLVSAPAPTDRSATFFVNNDLPHRYTVRAFNVAGGPSDTLAGSSDNGSTYLMHYADGPSGRLVGTSRSGQPFDVSITRPETQCPVRYALSIWDSANSVVLYDSFAVDSIVDGSQVISDTLPTGTEPWLKLIMRTQSIDRPLITMADTTEGYFCLGVCGAANDQPLVIPDHFELAQNYPNPFNPETQIEFMVPYQSDVKVEIYNIAGQLVKTLVDGYVTAGVHHMTWNGLSNNGTNVTSGVYLYRMTGPGFVQTKKMLMLK